MVLAAVENIQYLNFWGDAKWMKMSWAMASRGHQSKISLSMAFLHASSIFYIYSQGAIYIVNSGNNKSSTVNYMAIFKLLQSTSLKRLQFPLYTWHLTRSHPLQKIGNLALKWSSYNQGWITNRAKHCLKAPDLQGPQKIHCVSLFLGYLKTFREFVQLKCNINWILQN